MHKLSDQSVYAKPEQYFEYANFLINQANKTPETALNSTQTKQAFELAESVKKRFSTQPNIRDQSKLATAQIHIAIGNEEQAQALIDSVLKDEHLEDLDARTLKLASSVLKANGNSDLSETLLEKAADIIENDPILIAEIYEQLNKDITHEHRKLAALKNKAGIQFYTNNELEQSANLLRQALKMTPRHISLNLNLIQVLLKLHKQSKDEKYLNEVNSLLKKIRHIPEDHKENRRYQFFKKRFEANG